MEKPTVRYEASMAPTVGNPCWIIPLDHPSELVLNGEPCRTTKVLAVWDDGNTFETKNTIYVKASDV